MTSSTLLPMVGEVCTTSFMSLEENHKHITENNVSGISSQNGQIDTSVKMFIAAVVHRNDHILLETNLAATQIRNYPLHYTCMKIGIILYSLYYIIKRVTWVGRGIGWRERTNKMEVKDLTGS